MGHFLGDHPHVALGHDPMLVCKPQGVPSSLLLASRSALCACWRRKQKASKSCCHWTFYVHISRFTHHLSPANKIFTPLRRATPPGKISTALGWQLLLGYMQTHNVCWTVIGGTAFGAKKVLSYSECMVGIPCMTTLIVAFCDGTAAHLMQVWDYPNEV